MLHAEAVEHQVAALALFLVPQAFGGDDQVTALARPVQQAVGLARRDVLPAGEEDQRLSFGGQGIQDFQASSGSDLDPAAVEEGFRGQIVVGARSRRWAMLDGFAVGLQVAVQVEAARPQQQKHQQAGQVTGGPRHACTPLPNSRRQPSHRLALSSSAGATWP
ncbi:hypothetical protein D3C80_1511800 [compost metagenome]